MAITISGSGITSANIADGTIVSNDISASANIPASKLSGVGPTKSASDPALDTNGSVGDEWINTTSGEKFICTDATTDGNVWKNQRRTEGDIKPWIFGGTNYGYASGGGSQVNVIERVSFSSDGNATDVGDLMNTPVGPAGSSSETHTYISGGHNGSGNILDIQKFSFASGTDSASIGNLSMARNGTPGYSSADNGYVGHGSNEMSGWTPYSAIDKFSFSSDGNSTDIGDCTMQRGASGCSSVDYGYTAGGYVSRYVYANVIDRISYTTDGNATDVADLTFAVTNTSDSSSPTHGYVSGGYTGSFHNVIQKFSFSTSSNATDVGDLTGNFSVKAGATSTTHGYSLESQTSGGVGNTINKYSHTSDANATDVGDLTINKYGRAGSQY